MVVAELDGSLAEEDVAQHLKVAAVAVASQQGKIRTVAGVTDGAFPPKLEVTEPAVSMEIVEEIKECSLRVDALVPELQCLELVAEVVVVKEVVCNNASEIATDEVEVSVPR